MQQGQEWRQEKQQSMQEQQQGMWRQKHQGQQQILEELKKDSETVGARRERVTDERKKMKQDGRVKGTETSIMKEREIRRRKFCQERKEK